ncbi:CDGSH iron-sulfur domain-containing protein [Sphingomonas sp. MMSM20]|uniref:ferritin-like domain-containing protein n=1 Tax=Sphingomonas lycopersici TaxID=2951807 RepID=UPI002238BE1F|nr:ferritin-like domain-containing protein [Sphingomonas lycopersici]MCW6530778.1 CDGSH iron-sulfur domain-containing protein [Sphingomonas lycopersici]
MSQDNPVPAVSREKIMHALYEAAEIEHCLMCTYLYAAFSLRDGEGEGLTAEEAAAVARWRRMILGVAVDEMSHLVAVWNITAALGGAPHFGRANFPLDPGYLPAGLVVRLAPFNEAVIQHFVYLERPEGSHEPDGEGFEGPAGLTRAIPGLRLTPTGYDYRTVGEFYEEISANLRQFVEQIGEEAVFCGDPALQLSQAESRLVGAKPVTHLESALSAIETIIIEGEGAPADRDNSHFQRFTAIREEFKALKSKNPGFVAAHPAAVNPVLRRPPQPEGRVWIENADAMATIDLANAAYALMLRLLAEVYALPSSDDDKLLYVGTAVGLMQALTVLAERAARLPAGPSNPHCNAGVSFTALRDTASFPPGASARRYYLERMEELGAAAESIDQSDPRCLQAAKVLHNLTARLRDAPAPKTLTAPVTPPSAPVAPPAIKTDQGIEVVEGENLTIMFDEQRCIHARFCVTQAPATFLANMKGSWINADTTEPELLSGTIRQCASGALSYRRKDGHNETAPPVNLLSLRENGPYAVRAFLKIDGKEAGFRATLCRCGASANKPFCDGSHVRIGFTATGEPPSEDSPILAVRDGPLSVTPQTDGPLQVEGNLEITSGTGRRITSVRSTRLCRCGGSASKPFCDGTHARIGFRSAN